MFVFPTKLYTLWAGALFALLTAASPVHSFPHKGRRGGPLSLWRGPREEREIFPEGYPTAMEIKILRLEWVFISWEISINLGQKTQGKPVDLETARKRARDYRAFGRTGLRPSHVWAVFFCSPSFLNFVLCLILQGALSFWWQLSNLVNKFIMTD